jgi:hypothetical protein
MRRVGRCMRLGEVGVDKGGDPRVAGFVSCFQLYISV